MITSPGATGASLFPAYSDEDGKDDLVRRWSFNLLSV